MAYILQSDEKIPQIGENCFLAPNATLVGAIQMGNFCSVWFNAVVRGDVNTISIGNYVNIQDGVCVHCTYQKTATVIGNYVSVGHNAILHGCTLEDYILIGMGAIVMDNCVIESYSIIAAGSVLLEGTHVASGSLYAGVPAKFVKWISDEQKQMIKQVALNYVNYAKRIKLP